MDCTRKSALASLSVVFQNMYHLMLSNLHVGVSCPLVLIVHVFPVDIVVLLGQITCIFSLINRMEFSDFMHNFDSLEICNLTPDSPVEMPKQWNTAEYHGRWQRGFNAGGRPKYRGVYPC